MVLCKCSLSECNEETPVRNVYCFVGVPSASPLDDVSLSSFKHYVKIAIARSV